MLFCCSVVLYNIILDFTIYIQVDQCENAKEYNTASAYGQPENLSFLLLAIPQARSMSNICRYIKRNVYIEKYNNLKVNNKVK